MRRHRKVISAGRKTESGAAVIEFALALPVLAMVFLGMVDVSLALTEKRRLAYAAGVMADLVTRHDGNVTAANIEDYVNAVALAVRPRPIGDVKVQVHGYRVQNNVVASAWQKSNDAGPACAAPETSGLPALMADSNDVVVAVVCTSYTPQLIAALAPGILGSGAFILREEVAQRPRASLQLTCTDC